MPAADPDALATTVQNGTTGGFGGWRAALVVGVSLLIAVIAYFGFFLDKTAGTHEIAVRDATPAGRPAAIGFRLERAPGDPVAVGDVVLDVGWTSEGDGWFMTRGSAAAARYRGPTDGTVVLTWRTGPGSGVARLVVDGEDRGTVDLTTSEAGTRVEVIALPERWRPVGLLLVPLLGVAAAPLVAAAVGPSRLVRSRRPDDRAEPTWSSTVSHGALVAVPWSALLVVFWPGLIAPDGMIQWTQLAQDGPLDDWHPYAITLAWGAIRAMIDLPAIAIGLQIVAASLVAGRWAAWLRQRGCPSWARVCGLLLVGILPASALLGISLYKDTVYGLALFALCFALWRMEDTHGAWAAQWRGALTLAGAALIAWVSRHNGWPAVVIALLIVIVRYPQARRATVAVGASTAALAVIVQWPLAHALGVRPSRVDEIVAAQHIALHLAAGTTLSAEERSLVEFVHPIGSRWPYACGSIQPTWSGVDAVPVAALEANGAELRALALRLALRNPAAELRHLRCSSSLIWRPLPAPDAPTYFIEWSRHGELVDYVVPPIGDAPVEASPAPRAAAAIFDGVAALPEWARRPALPLYFLLAGIGVAGWRRRSLGPLLIAAPVLVHTAALLPLTLVQDVRFQYPLIVVAAFLTPALLATRSRDTAPVTWWSASQPSAPASDEHDALPERCTPTTLAPWRSGHDGAIEHVDGGSAVRAETDTAGYDRPGHQRDQMHIPSRGASKPTVDADDTSGPR